MSAATTTKHEKLLTRLHQQTQRLLESDGWNDWLRVAARFHRYSTRNTLLIAAQRPDATRVAGYRTWQSLGRNVKRGEHGIAIMAPVTRKVDDDEGKERVLAGFRIVHVFDVAQTEGEPLPELSMPQVGVSDEALLDRLKEVADTEPRSLGMVELDDVTDTARGWYDPATGEITLVNGYSPQSQVRTLLHELGHHCDPTIHEQQDSDRAVGEIVAESAAYIVGTNLGVDMDQASALYLANWAGFDHDVDHEMLERLAGHVLVVARRLEDLTTSVLART